MTVGVTFYPTSSGTDLVTVSTVMPMNSIVGLNGIYIGIPASAMVILILLISVSIGALIAQ